ncbi:MAG TPA: ATP-dependent helicase [Acidimicrobiales bacterium]|nr:ATP-dependent helicase [Acidimicrobiales bacterium]
MTWELNPQQRRSVEHDDRPLLVLAGAGTGKTATLAARLAHLLERGAQPERVCLVTFSRRAAAEMRTRAGHMVDPALAARVVGGTFHSVAQRLLRHHGRLIGLDPSFSVLDAADSTELIGLVRSESDVCGRDGARFPRKETLAAILSRVANAQVRLSEVVARSFPWCSRDIDAMRAVFAAYTSRKRAQQLCDFDDLLLLVRALGGSEVGRGMLSGLFDHVLVDEYQDVNPLQADLVDLLRPGGCGVTAVGDDAQAIYGFRAASTVAILDFPRRYADAAVVRLEHNYRSTTPILAVANQVMADEPGGTVKALWSERPGRRRPLLRSCADEATQAEAVCASVLAHREDGVALRSQAVLFRAGHHSTTLEVALGRRRIPYVKYGGLRFVEAAHVKDLLALLRLLDNPWDEMAWFRVLRLLEGVGPATAGRVLGQLGVRRPDATSDVGPVTDPGAASPLTRLLAAAPAVPGPAREDLAGLRAALAECSGAAPAVDTAPPVGAQVDRLRQWLGPVVLRRYDAPAARCSDLERLAEQGAAASSRTGFVSDLTLDPPVVTGDLAGPPSLDDDWLVLSTVHSAKGGEWDVVHVIHAADGMFPSDLATGDEAALAEERRLFYVAVTRARNALEVSMPLRYHRHRHGLDDRHGYAPVSRFLSPAVQSLMDAESAVPSSDVVPAGAVVSGPAGGVAAVDRLLAELWS